MCEPPEEKMLKNEKSAKNFDGMDTLQSVYTKELPSERLKSGKKSDKCTKILEKSVDIGDEK